MKDEEVRIRLIRQFGNHLIQTLSQYSFDFLAPILQRTGKEGVWLLEQLSSLGKVVPLLPRSWFPGSNGQMMRFLANDWLAQLLLSVSQAVKQAEKNQLDEQGFANLLSEVESRATKKAKELQDKIEKVQTPSTKSQQRGSWFKTFLKGESSGLLSSLAELREDELNEFEYLLSEVISSPEPQRSRLFQRIKSLRKSELLGLLRLKRVERLQTLELSSGLLERISTSSRSVLKKVVSFLRGTEKKVEEKIENVRQELDVPLRALERNRVEKTKTTKLVLLTYGESFRRSLAFISFLFLVLIATILIAVLGGQ